MAFRRITIAPSSRIAQPRVFSENSPDVCVPKETLNLTGSLAAVGCRVEVKLAVFVELPLWGP